MEVLSIRPMRREDNPAVADVIRTVMTEFGAVGRGFSIEDPEVDAMYEAYQGPRSCFFVVTAGDRVVGCGGLAPLVGGDPDVCELRKMYYLPSARGQGAGRRLLELLIASARSFGYRQMYLETLARMEGAARLYAKVGFASLPGPCGSTGHCGCDNFYLLNLAAP